MKNFIVMILSVSIFFICLGGVVKKIQMKLNSEDHALLMFPQASTKIDNEKGVNSRKSFAIIRKSHKPLNIDNEKFEAPDGNRIIKLTSPEQPRKVLEFQRRLNLQPLKQGEELPGISHENVIILKKGENINLPEESAVKLQPFKVLIDKENKKENKSE